MKILDRYSLLCISISFILLMTVFFSNEEPKDNDILGIAFNIKATENGHTFLFEDTQGNIIKCFSRIEPKECLIYFIKGTLSDDNSMFFVSSLKEG